MRKYFLLVKKKRKMNRKLFDISTLNLNNLCFSEPETKSIPGQKLSYQRIRLSVKEGDESYDCLFRSPSSLLSWGIQESTDMATNELVGYQMPIVLWTNSGNDAERSFTDGFHRFCQHTKDYLITNRSKFGKYDLEASDLKKFNPLYWRMEKGKIVDESKGPTLYGKCLYDRKSQKIGTLFVNELTKQIVSPETLIGKHLYVTFVLRVEGIFIGNRLSLQMRIAEVLYREKEEKISSLLCPEAVVSSHLEDYEKESDESDEESDEESDVSFDTPLPVEVLTTKEVVQNAPVTRRARARA